MSRRKIDPRLSVAATDVIDDALDQRQRRALEVELAADPDLATELDELRVVVASVRATRPTVSSEPDWDAMVENVLSGARASQPAPRPPWWRRLFRPLPAAAGFTLVAAAAAVLLWLSRDSAALLDELATTSTAPPAAKRTVIPRLADVDELDSDELVLLEAGLDAAFAEDLEPGAASSADDWLGDVDETGDLLLPHAAELGISAGWAAELDLIESLSDEQLDSLARALDAEAG